MIISGVALALFVQPATDPIGSGLRPGMQLVYSANGRAQPPWEIDSAASPVALEPHDQCAVILLRRRPSPAPAEETRLCARGDTLFSWTAASSQWQPTRPIAPEMKMIFARDGGDTVTYTTGVFREEVISGVRVSILETTVLTVDSLGRPKRRLRERYARGLATATGGTFEVPDPAGPEGWRPDLTFELTEIRNRN